MKHILILGSRGMLGTALMRAFSKDSPIGWDKDEIDITNQKAVTSKIQTLKPDIIINAAAYTDVDGCESNKKTCMAVNGTAVGYLADVATSLQSIFVHFSTDYVFRGDNKKGYDENAQDIDPPNVYGQSKAQGEDFAQKTPLHYLIRLSWLFGPQGKNFVDTMLNLASEHDTLQVVNDQHGKPTYTIDLAQRIRSMIQHAESFGVYHVTNEGSCAWYDFAKEIFRLAHMKTQVLPCSSSEFPRPAKRPQYSILINTKLPPMRPWKQALKHYIKSYT